MRYIIVMLAAAALVACGDSPEGGGSAVEGHPDFDAECFDQDEDDDYYGLHVGAIPQQALEISQSPNCLDDYGFGRWREDPLCEGRERQYERHDKCYEFEDPDDWEVGHPDDYIYDEPCLWVVHAHPAHDSCRFRAVCATEDEWPAFRVSDDGAPMMDDIPNTMSWDEAIDHQCHSG